VEKERVSVASVQRLARQHGFDSPTALATAAGVNPNTARRWWIDDPTITRYEASIIIAFCKLFGVQPGDLLTFVSTEGDELSTPD